MHLHIRVVSEKICSTKSRSIKQKKGKADGMGRIDGRDHVVI
jgi:hypothetical protein